MCNRQLGYEVVFAILIAAGSLYGQAAGSLVGTVRDSSAAVVAGAEVVATHNETGVTHIEKTSASGDYIFPILPVGTYTLTVNLKSFQEVKIENIEIHVATTIRQDSTLSPAAVATKVQVIASTPMVKAETSEIGQLVGSSQITDLPLNGRDAYSLVQLTAGAETGPAYSEGYGSSLFRPAVGGGRGGYTVFRVDGQDVQTQNISSAEVEPNVDALQEFRAITQLAPASESSTSSVSVATKAGTNRFHGTVYDFFRNNVLDAHPYFQVVTTVPQYTFMKDQLRYNQFGGSLGGPIRREKTFFFASVQLARSHALSQSRQLFPTAQMLQGDFSGIDPLTGVNFAPVNDPQYWSQWPTNVPFQGNVVPSSRWSSFAKEFLPVGVVPANCMACLSAGLGFNWVGTLPAIADSDQYFGRIDHNFREQDRLFGSFQVTPGLSKSWGSPLPATELDTKTKSVYVNLNETHIFGPALVNEFRGGYVLAFGSIAQPTLPGQNPFVFANTPFRESSEYPAVDVIGYPDFGNQEYSTAEITKDEVYDFKDSLTYMRGTHEVQAGFELMRDHLGNLSYNNALFEYTDGLPTIYGYSGNGFADFLLGLPFVGLTYQGTGKAAMVERSIYAGYIQDNWKIHPRLTLNFGMRYEFPQAWHDNDAPRLNRLGTLDTGPESRALGGRFLLGGSPDYYVPGTGVIQGTGSPLIRGSLIDPTWKDFQPRLGFAFRPFNNNKTAIRGGFGTYFALQDGNSVAFEMLSPPYDYAALFINLPPSVPYGAPLHDVDFFPEVGVGGTTTDGDDPHNRDPRMYEWTFGVQHQLSNSLLVSVEYLGNHGIKNPLGIPINEPPLPNVAQLAALEANPSSDATAGQARSPFPNVPVTYGYIENIGNSWYEALNVNVEKRLAQRLNFSAVYTWSKALDVGSYELEHLVSNDSPSKSYADFDHPQRFVASGVYNLPFGETMLVPKNRALKKLAAGWEVSGISTFEGGPPFSVHMGADTSFQGGAVSVFPNLAGPPVYSNIRASNGIYLTEQNFAAPPFGQLGTLARHAFHGPGINNFDLGLMKNIALAERMRLQFRTEMFNAFNHAQFSMADQSLAYNMSAPPAGSTQPVINYVPPSSFGRVSDRGTRVVQLAIKLIW